MVAHHSDIGPERRKQLDELIRENTSIKVLQHKYGFNYKTVRKYYPTYRTRTDAYLKDNFDSITDEQWLIIGVMIGERAPITAISEVSGVGDDLLRKLFPEAAWSKSEAGTLGGIISTYK